MQSFAIVPVLDLKGGQVVHARAGERANYRPIESKLATGSEPERILAGLLSLAPFRSVYIADLDAIEGRGDHRADITALARQYPELEFWVDAGVRDAASAGAVAALGAVPVLGSESWSDLRALAAALDALGTERCLLSLDYRGEEFLGPSDLLEATKEWPARIIAMTLSRVGRGAGPDWQRLAMLAQRAGKRRLFAAGGVRGRGDLEGLASRGVAGVLVATALHDGSLDREILADFAAVSGGE
jgi:phosphoribosylformimino-5-aminoimidazole carboxamide ribotide isomerase